MQDDDSGSDRKTIAQRGVMTDLERLRHSCAHVLATAIARLWPDAQFAYGPPVDTGFYYDVDLKHRISPDDFARIESEMKREIKANHPFEKIEVTREQAIADSQSGRLGALTERPDHPSIFKLDLIGQIPEGETISYYRNGDFIDLCAGPHVHRTGNIGAFKLTSVASAYYKGDERNPQLQRVYGTAFKNKAQLEEWLHLQEEARKRDHRKLGTELHLFALDPDFVGPGMPLWLPNGAAMMEELEKLAKETEFAAGYLPVRTPHIARERMYLTSGHLPYYADSMFPRMRLPVEGQRELEEERTAIEQQISALPEEESSLTQVRDAHDAPVAQGKETIKTLKRLVTRKREIEQTLDKGEPYYLKAMNCPHHHRIYGAEPRSYRDLPLRLAEYGCCYRYEQSGELFGLMRVRSLNMNDAHIYCTPDQFAAEFNAVNEMYLKYFKIFGIDKYVMRFSTHAPEGLGRKYVDEPALWLQTESMVREVLQSSGIPFVEVPDEAAFYGPKIDVQVWSVIGREFTLATNQVDFAVPARFNLTYRDRDNCDKTPLCIHRAPLGTHERFIGFLTEHYAGNFPLWLAPEQVRVLTIGADASLVAYARSIVAELRAHLVRAGEDVGTDKINGKIQRAEQARVHTMLVIGPRDLQAGHVSVRVHAKGPQGASPRVEAIARILDSIRERRA